LAVNGALKANSLVLVPVWNVLHQAETEGGRGNAENDVGVGKLLSEIRLRYVAARRIAAPSYREQVMHAAVERTVRIEDEPRLANRAIRSDEGRYGVCRAVQDRNRDLRVSRDCSSRVVVRDEVPGRASAAHGWEYMAART